MHSHVPTSCRAQAIEDARLLVNNPEAAHQRPSLRIFAWATLKSARGQPVSQIKLRQMQDRQRAVDAPACVSVRASEC